GVLQCDACLLGRLQLAGAPSLYAGPRLAYFAQVQQSPQLPALSAPAAIMSLLLKPKGPTVSAQHVNATAAVLVRQVHRTRPSSTSTLNKRRTIEGCDIR